MEWRNASSLSRVYDPDFRITSISVTEGDTTLNTGDGAGIQRFYRDLNELNQSDRIDFYIPIKGSKKATLSTGLSGTYKYRDFSVYNYKLDRTDANDIQADPDWFLQTENLWSADPNDPNYRDGTFLIGNFQPSNQYQSNQYIAGAYVKAEHPVGALWKFVYGLRVENTQIRYNGEDQNGNVYDNQVTLDATNLLPSANLVYGLNENTNIRGSANRTLARPTFREISKAQI
jgi:outer membrane receptor protein involved in Fe transport